MSGFRKKKTSSDTGSHVIRPLGLLEGYESVQHLLGLYYSCAVTCRYATPGLQITSSNGSSIEDVGERALALTILEHPLLQVGLADEDSKKPSWVQLKSLDLRKQLEWLTVAEDENDEDTLLGALQAKHTNPFTNQNEQPTWRVVVLKTAGLAHMDVLFAYNHAMGDGMSGKIFHQSLLKKLNLVSSGQLVGELQDHTLSLPTITNLTPPMEELLKFPMSPGFLAIEGWKGIRPSFATTKSASAASWAPVNYLPREIGVRLVRVDDAALQVILDKCRQEKTTLTGLLHTLIFLSFAARLQPDRARAFEAGTPFNMRRYLTAPSTSHPDLKPDTTIGNFAAFHTYRYGTKATAKIRAELQEARNNTEKVGVLERSLWSIAQDFKVQLAEKLAAGPKDNTLGLLKLVSNWKKYFKDEYNKPRVISWEVSNLGAFSGQPRSSEAPSSDGDGWTIDRAIFSQSAAVLGPAYLVNPISVAGRNLMLSCTWQKDVVEEAFGIGVTADLQRWLDDLGRGSHLRVDEL
ncbi:putative Alcohol acetyltransferase [Seiridium cardinale]|uniref:Alcohol acetyltransferase n=1 Tax=Seiridium cardinale TaxID=138064 RepID=A0ABR2XW38_9PEZI